MTVGPHEAEQRWARAVNAYCPVGSEGGFWRQSRGGDAPLPRQGWKVHVSATPLNAAAVLEAVGPVLSEERLSFKAVSSLSELRKLNCGLYYGHSQIGKVLTIYPENPERCVSVARRLAHQLRGQPGPAVPYERRVSDDSPVFARYGVIAGESGAATLLRRPDGTDEPDRRDVHPSWVDVPSGLFAQLQPTNQGPLATDYKAWGFLSQRGKGGVYRALDLTSTPARLCVLKEGRRYGEMDLDGEDGYVRVGQELRILDALARSGVPVPKVYSAFEQGGHIYLVLEWMAGGSLAEYILSRRDDPITMDERVDLCLQVALLVAQVHRTGWVWRDLKPANLLIDEHRQVRPIDFEGAARRGSRTTSPWGSPGHLPPEWLQATRVSVTQDRYALGVVLRQILSHSVIVDPTGDYKVDIDPAFPSSLRSLVDRLTLDDPAARPSASSAARTVQAARQRMASKQP